MNDKTTQLALFCDEAGKDTDRFLAVGGLVVTSEAAPVIRSEMAGLIKSLNIGKEVKWNHTKTGLKDKYQQIVHYLFSLIDSDLAGFHCILVDFQRFNHDLRDGGNKGESLKRMYYQLILHRLCKKHGRDCSLYAFPDKANELVGLEGLKSALNIESKYKFGFNSNCVKAIEFRDSKTELLLQLNDLILGGICYQKNRRFESEGAGHPKANLAGYIMGKTGLPNYDTNTPKSQTRLSIWNFDSKHLKGVSGA